VRTAGRVFRALADPTRRQILEELKPGELSAGEIAGRFAISAPSISRHLAILKAAELVSERRDGNRILYRLEPETLITSLNVYLSAVCPTQVRQRRKIAARRS
jgi:DNA-binding transcriptional ArsR family regulator